MYNKVSGKTNQSRFGGIWLLAWALTIYNVINIYASANLLTIYNVGFIQCLGIVSLKYGEYGAVNIQCWNGNREIYGIFDCETFLNSQNVW